MGSFLVIFPTPCFDDYLGVRQAGEPVFVQAFAPETSVERFDISVLIGLARFNQKQFHSAQMGPQQHGSPAKLFSIVSADRFRQPALHGQSIQNTRQRLPTNGPLRHDGKAPRLVLGALLCVFVKGVSVHRCRREQESRSAGSPAIDKSADMSALSWRSNNSAAHQPHLDREQLLAAPLSFSAHSALAKVIVSSKNRLAGRSGSLKGRADRQLLDKQRADPADIKRVLALFLADYVSIL